MGRRWTLQEETSLKEVRNILKDELAERIQFPEVVGDRRLLRFLRGKSFKIDESVKCIRDFFKWRDTNDVDKIRQDIIYGGKDTPFKFPFGKAIIDIAPQIIISAISLDKKGRPLAMETFNFSPKEIFEAVPISDYLVFLIYTLEYRAIVLEQMSHEREVEYINKHPNPEDRKDGYGVIVMDYTIRDLKGVGLAHLGSKGRALVAAALNTALPNYPEFLARCVMINTPWVFNTFWYFVKGFLDEITAVKIAMCGSDYMPVLLEDMELQYIPERVGGQFTQYNEAYVFDTSVGGPLYCEDTTATVVVEGEGIEVGESDSIKNQTDTCWHTVPTPTASVKSDSSQKPLSTGSSSRSRRPHPNSSTHTTSTTTSASDTSYEYPIPVLQQENNQNTPAAGRNTMNNLSTASNISTGSSNLLYNKDVFSIDYSIIYRWCWKYPVRLLITVLCLCIVLYLLVTGLLPYILYPCIIYVTVLNTRPAVWYFTRFYSINPEHSEG